MISNRFDAIARSVNAMRSRRSLVGLLAGGLLGISNLRQGGDASLAKARKKRKKRQKATACPKARRCGKKCCRGNTRCQRGVCRKRKPAAKPPQTDNTPVRKNIFSLSAAELDAFIRGIAVMQARPADDPLSWTAQANRHRDYAQHGNYHFLPWHRMFLYHFEQILRDAADDQSLTVPYWSPNPETGTTCVLPVPFRTPGNPLYRADRNPTVNNGVVPPAYDWFSTWSTLNVPQFVKTEGSAGFGGSGGPEGLGGSLERGQHDNLHNWVGAGGGAMARPEISPLDPIFWLHHANIDRLWEAWLRQPGRANPTSDPVFMDSSFQFVDRNRQPVSMTARDVLDVVRQLNYRYDDQPVGGNPNAGKVTSLGQTAMSAARAEPRPLVIATAPGRNLGPQQVKVPVAVKPGAVARFRSVKQAKGPVRLTLKGVGSTGVTGIFYEIHVGKTKPNPTAKHTSYVGSINPFSVEVASHAGHGGHHSGGTDFTFDITRAVAAGGGVKQVIVTLVPVNMGGSGNSPAGPWMTVDQFVVEVNAGSAGTKTKGKKGKPARKKAQGPKAKQFRKRRQQQNAAKRRRLANKRRQQQRRRQAAEATSSPASQTGGDGVNVPGARHSSFFDLPGTEPDAAATEADHAHH